MKDHERVLAEWKNRYQAAIRASGMLLYDWDPRTNDVAYEGNLKEMLGYSLEEMAGGLARWIDLVHPEDRAGFQKEAERLVTSKEPAHLQYRVRRKDGSYIIVRDDGYFFADRDGHPLRMIGFVSDITERKRSEEALRHSEEEYRSLVENVRDVIYTVSPDGIITSLNPAFEAITGWPSDEWLGRSFEPLIHPEDLSFVMGEFKRILEGERPSLAEYRILARSGEYRIGEFLATPRMQDGKIIGLLGIARDITERKRAEKKFRGILEFAPEAMVVINKTGRIVLVNTQTEKMFGYRRHELMDQPVEILLPERLRTMHAGHRTRYFTQPSTRPMGAGMELVGRRRDGTEFPVEISLSPLETEEGFLVMSAIRDITERKRSDEVIRQRNQELATLNTVTAAVSSSLELTEVFATLKTQLVDCFDIPGGWIFIYDETSDRLDLRADWGLPPVLLKRFKTFPVVGSHNERVIREKEAILRPDFREVVSFLEMGLQDVLPQWKDYLSVPLIAKGEIQGILEMFSRAPASFDKEQVAFFTALGQEVGVAVQNARLFEQVRSGRERLQLLSRQLVQVQEAERRQIARELHDEIGQVLTGLKLTLEMSKRRPADRLRVSLDEALTLADDLIARVRELSLDLRPAMLDDLGLLPALLWLIERYTNRTGVQVNLEHTGIEKRFRPDLETAAYRIVQEALTNVARHADAKEVRVRLWTTGEALVLQVGDRGKGFDPARLQASGETGGLSGMRERADLLRGQLTVESSPGSGTRLTAELPLGDPIRRRKGKR